LNDAQKYYKKKSFFKGKTKKTTNIVLIMFFKLRFGSDSLIFDYS